MGIVHPKRHFPSITCLRKVFPSQDLDPLFLKPLLAASEHKVLRPVGASHRGWNARQVKEAFDNWMLIASYNVAVGECGIRLLLLSNVVQRAGLFL